MRSARLDATDWRILRELQADGRITNVELAPQGRHLGAAMLAARACAGGGRHHSRLYGAARRPRARLRRHRLRHGRAA